jgi:hypothetical protein
MYERPGLQLDISGSIDADADRRGLQRTLLESRIRTTKWQSLRRAEQGTTRADQVTVSAEERGELIQRLYAEALAAGKIQLGDDSSATQTGSASPTRAPAVRVASSEERGAGALMQGGVLPLPTTIGSEDADSDGIADPYERVLLGSIVVAESDFQSLASERATVVRQHLIEQGKVEPERLFLSASTDGTARKDGARVYLEFR